MSRRAIGLGLGAAAAYLAASLVAAGRVPVRPLYDGLAPPAPYRWVKPPPELAEDNESPVRAKEELLLGESGSAPGSVTTGDGQAAVSVPSGAFLPRGQAASVVVAITPLDPLSVGGHPGGLEFDGNAYAIRATYAGSRTAAPLDRRVTVLLRYPTHATRLLRWNGEVWESLDARQVAASLQIFGESGRSARSWPPARGSSRERSSSTPRWAQPSSASPSGWWRDGARPGAGGDGCAPRSEGRGLRRRAGCRRWDSLRRPSAASSAWCGSGGRRQYAGCGTCPASVTPGPRLGRVAPKDRA